MSIENQKLFVTSGVDEIAIRVVIIKIIEWIRYLLTKWVVLLFFGILGGVLGFVYATLKRPVYVASTTFVLEESSSSNSLGQYAGLASMIGIDVGSGGGIFQGDNIMELYRSRNMIEKTLLTEIEFNGKKMLLADLYLDYNNIRESWEGKRDLANFRFYKIDDSLRIKDPWITRVQDSIISSIVSAVNKNILTVYKPDKKLSIIKAEVKAFDEKFAKIFNDQIVKNVNDFYIQTKTKKSSQNISILEQKVDSVTRVMNGAIYSAAAISDATPNLNPTRQAQRAVPSQRSQFSAESNKAILSELVKNLEVSKITLRKEAPLIQVIDEPILPLEIERPRRIISSIFGAVGLIIIAAIYLLAGNYFKRLAAAS